MGIFKKKTSDEAQEAAPEEKVVEKKVVAKKVVKKTVKKSDATSTQAKAQAYRVLLGPIATEKSAMLSDRNILVLRVASSANRVSITNAIKALYNVTPVRVNVMNVHGKRVRVGRVVGKRSDWKKAIIKLPEGSHIDIFEGV